jgi:hypothetical protein
MWRMELLELEAEETRIMEKVRKARIETREWDHSGSKRLE